jgi:hypothetical protein
MRSSVLNSPVISKPDNTLALPASVAPVPVHGHWPALRATRLLDQVCERMRYLHYSLRTEKASAVASGRAFAYPGHEFFKLVHLRLLKPTGCFGRSGAAVSMPSSPRP